jgi:hypothetical protein
MRRAWALTQQFFAGVVGFRITLGEEQASPSWNSESIAAPSLANRPPRLEVLRRFVVVFSAELGFAQRNWRQPPAGQGRVQSWL